MGRRSETILHRAALRNRREMVEFLVKQRAPQVEVEMIELMEMVEMIEMMEVVEMLKQRTPQVQDVNGNTPLHCAALGGDAQVARMLLEGGADVEACNSEGDH